MIKTFTYIYIFKKELKKINYIFLIIWLIIDINLTTDLYTIILFNLKRIFKISNYKAKIFILNYDTN